MPKVSHARERAIHATAKLLCRQGYAATGLTEVLALSGAPKGSFYFHFPGGKEELATEAIRAADGYVRHMIRSALKDAGSPQEGVRALSAVFAGWLERSNYTEGCPVTTVALEMAPGSGELARACEIAFAGWEDLVERFFIQQGIDGSRSRQLANVTICSLEGALVLARTRRSADPFAHSAAMLEELV